MAATTTGTSSPCGACKFLRRKCAPDCVFAPYFCSEQGPATFAAIHKVFGASNISKLLLNLPAADRCEAVVTIAYEAQARIRDPVHGCVAHIFALQQQVASLQAQLMQVKCQMAQSLIDSRSTENQWPLNIYNSVGTEVQSMTFQSYNNNTNYPANNGYVDPVSPQSSIESVDYNNEAMSMHEIQSKDDQLLSYFQAAMRRPEADYSRTELGDLQSLAVRMMRN